ncbi:hypothetical protein K457DRAFT_1835879 [Linnemannia elongata AG-77]|uniref:Crinkler family protein n=1 Tax=Linnemannia elongata AG-77 TaxID=1314771 RepID=A0A197JJU4_9FUNG|nr:hypothetical protein K457DRAFT_1835879 [Linnemannia elongata AG-77]
MVFDAAFPEDTIRVVVQRPPPVAKRVREEDAGPSSTRKRHRPHTLMDAIEDAGLAEIAIVDDEFDLSRLDNKQRVVLLGCIGQMVSRSDTFYSLSSTAREFQGTNMKVMDKISAPHGTKLPVVNTNELFIRETYKELHDTILGRFDNARAGNETQNQIVVTGTSGIGKSAFLVYFAIRLLAESDDDNPLMIIFHTKRSSKCYAFGGRSAVRSGDIKDFEPFLSLPDTWYFVDSSPDPVLDRAKTVISASPKTLFSEAHQYQDVDKGVAWRYYMAPWSLEELTMCRTNVTSFQVVPLEAMEDLYAKIGGVPRYVLERPMKELNLIPDDLESAKAMACERLGQALDRVKDPVMLMQFFAQGKDTLDFSSRLIHRWPTNGHRTLIADPSGSSSGIMFEAYVLRVFREGGHIFEIKDLGTGQSTQLRIPRNPQSEHFSTISPVAAGTLCIPRSRNYACVDLLMAPRNLFQITISRIHAIKGPPLSKLIGSLIEAHWISPDDEPWLIFVVPSQVYADFETQNYLSSERKVYQRLPAALRRVRQHVLKIDLESAAAGRSPGLQIPIQ